MSFKHWSIVSFIIILLFVTACSNTEEEGIREVDAEAVFAMNDAGGELEVRFFYLDPLEGTEKTGLSTLIRTPEGQTILIDAGIPSVGPLIDDYLSRLDIDTIDYAVASHPHSDHIGGYTTLFETKKIGKLFETDLPYDSNLYIEYQDLIAEKEIDVEYVEKGNTFELEEDMTLEFLNPSQEKIDKYLDIFDDFSAGIINDLSLVAKLTYKDTTFLFPGDIYDAVESELVNEYGEKLDVDVLVAPHHGQHTSSSKKFIEAVNPEITVIPINLLYSRTTYEDYIDHGSEVFVSQFDGNVLLITDGNVIDVYSEFEKAEKVSN
ncbi:ComEC/Rec2 family competence protein [Ornithinibacillus halophilus]|uniref:Metal-dependent hydrolase, beta-lactamase superfamily II n=1 Tax=Ornithinibacillus halophilus TaxID=930117 RepID=A0A1M5HMK5_9BACI|nr:MBL fold metallo-hydrolase [Ornithinibacillus halophilus]SHG17209.1 Metal-dependent hydrolase, beta-lactamase superfamily II [Ornithinibacillus halophilus]